jgi:hypothetical protein
MTRSPTPIDQRRLRDGATALAASSGEPPRTRAEAEERRRQIHEAIAAMQSLDDLGEEGNRQAMQDLDELIRRYDALGAQIKELDHTFERGIPRDQRQAMITSWAELAFGREEATGIPQRGLRLLEEAIEAFQACGCDEAIAHKLVTYVFERPRGEIGQELGGVAVTVLALAAAAGLSADEEECREIHRVLGKPLSTFAQRNAAKNAAGFKIP